MKKYRHETLMAEVIDQIPELYIAELVQVADFIQALKNARSFTGIL